MYEVNLDRFAQDPCPVNRTEETPWAVCEGCGGDIYDDAIEMPDGGLVHDDMDCVMRYPGVRRRVG